MYNSSCFNVFSIDVLSVSFNPLNLLFFLFINKYKEFNFEYIIPEEETTEDEQIVKRKNIEMKPMDEEEAILQMNLLGHEFFVYKDINTNKVCVIYKRKDGHYGLIETN